MITQVNHEICFGDATGSLSVAISGGTAPYSYNTTSINGPYDAVADPTDLLIENLNGGTTHVVFIEDANGCRTNVFQEINVGVDLSSSVATNYSCNNGAPMSTTIVSLVDSSIENEVLYILDSDDINLATPDNVFENVGPGEHYINILHSGGCMIPTATFTVDELNPVMVELIQGDINEIAFVPSGGSGDYTYYINDEPIAEPSYFVVSSEEYTVKVIDSEGCEASLVVSMEFVDVEIPKFFTPDGDGINDVWYVKNASGYKNLQVIVYDRYGRKLYSIFREGEWNGNYEGTDLPAGDYWYIIKLNHEDDKREFIGNFTIYR